MAILGARDDVHLKYAVTCQAVKSEINSKKNNILPSSLIKNTKNACGKYDMD
jgi:hypothetical protein